jgi:adenylate cyclase
MAIEIERKYLVTSECWRSSDSGKRITQGYLSRDPDRTVRVRIVGNDAFMTVKGRTSGISRTEIEFPIARDDAEAMMQLCIRPLIDKTRYEVNYDGMIWEIDEFHGLNKGLIIAEIELPSEDTAVTLPDWIGLEVTDDFRYANSSLSEVPFQQWPVGDLI